MKGTSIRRGTTTMIQITSQPTVVNLDKGPPHLSCGFFLLDPIADCNEPMGGSKPAWDPWQSAIYRVNSLKQAYHSRLRYCGLLQQLTFLALSGNTAASSLLMQSTHIPTYDIQYSICIAV